MSGLPALTFPFSLSGGGFRGPYKEALDLALAEIFLKLGVASRGDLFKQLPYVFAKLGGDTPPTLTFCLLAEERPHLFKFFYDVLHAWLMPYQSMGVPLLHTISFNIKEWDLQLTYCELQARFDSVESRDNAMQNLEYLKGQIVLGVRSNWFARRLLEFKGFSLDEKAVAIHQQIYNLIHRFPTSLNESLFQEMHYTLLSVADLFKEQRSPRHLTRLILLGFLFKKEIEKLAGVNSEKRILKVNLFRQSVGVKDRKKAVLSVVVGVNFLDQREFLEERHLLKAIKDYLPDVALVPGSFYTTRKEAPRLQILYLEVEKTNGAPFTSLDLLTLRDKLPSDLNDRIERLIHPIFMPQNEEEIMRNIVQVAQEVRYVNDPPHVILSFEEQTQEELLFYVLISRVVGVHAKSFYEIFQSPTPLVNFQVESVKKVGVVRKKYPKEACHVRARLPKEPFLRKDLSVDLYRARARLAKELKLVLGSFRDYNGGLIAKEKEVFSLIQEFVWQGAEGDDFLLENFFFSIHPLRMRTVVSPKHMGLLFSQMAKVLEERNPLLEVHYIPEGPLSVVVLSSKLEADRLLHQAIREACLNSQEYLTSSLKKERWNCVGVLVQTGDLKKRTQLLNRLRAILP